MKHISMNAEMTKAVLNGKKTQFRKYLKNTKYSNFDNIMFSKKLYHSERVVYYNLLESSCSLFENKFIREYSKYQKNEIVYIREPAKIVEFSPAQNVGGGLMESSARVRYLADGYETYWDEFPENPKSWLFECKGVPGGCIKTMARIFLKITNIRIEKLQDISTLDMIEEGLKRPLKTCIKWATQIEEELEPLWINLWNKTAQKGYKWNNNPYVFVYEFKVLDNKEIK